MAVTPEIFSKEVQDKFKSCQLRGCINMTGPMWEPVIVFTPDDMQMAYFALGNWYCERHKNEISLDDLIKGSTSSGVDAWDRVVYAFTSAGKAPPIKESTELIWRLA